MLIQVPVTRTEKHCQHSPAFAHLQENQVQETTKPGPVSWAVVSKDCRASPLTVRQKDPTKQALPHAFQRTLAAAAPGKVHSLPVMPAMGSPSQRQISIF